MLVYDIANVFYFNVAYTLQIKKYIPVKFLIFFDRVRTIRHLILVIYAHHQADNYLTVAPGCCISIDFLIILILLRSFVS